MASPRCALAVPDIEVVNDKNRPGVSGGAQWKNVPWAEHPNDIIATIHNRGNDDAPAVEVHFAYYDFSVGEEPTRVELGDVTLDVPAFQSVQATFSGWTPPGDGHYCVIAEIKPYTSAATETQEIDSTNNRAQSNYTKYWSATASPATRIVHDVTVHNPYDAEAIVHLRITHSSTEFRSYLSSRWLRMAANEERVIQVAHEYTEEDFEAIYNEFQGDYNPQNNVEVSAWIVDPEIPLEAEHTERVMGGVSMSVAAGIATEIRSTPRYETGSVNLPIEGLVVRKDTGRGMTSGDVLISIFDKDGALLEVTRQTVRGADGAFTLTTTAPGGVGHVEVEYVGDAPFAPSKWSSEP